MHIDEDYTLLLGSTLAQKMSLITIESKKFLDANNIVFATYYLGLTMEEITVNNSDALEGQWCVRGGLQPEGD